MGLSQYRFFGGKQFKLYREYPRFSKGVTAFEDSKELQKSGYYVRSVPSKHGRAIYIRKGYEKKGVSDNRYFEGKLYNLYKRNFERRIDAQKVVEQLRKKGYLVRKVRYEGVFYLYIRK